MIRWALSATLTVTAMAACALTPTTSQCSTQLGDERILEIVRAELTRRGGSFDPGRWTYRVTREQCDYFFLSNGKETSSRWPLPGGD